MSDKPLNPPKRKDGQCMSCCYFGFSTIEGFTCFHHKKHNVETSDFCYDWEDIEDINLE